MEGVRDSITVQFRKLWSLYLRRMHLCKQLEKQALPDDKQPFVKHFYDETVLFLNEAGNFDWVRGQTCLPAITDCASLYDTDTRLIQTYTNLQSDASWEQEYPELARFLMRNLGRVKASLRLIRHLTAPSF